MEVAQENKATGSKALGSADYESAKWKYGLAMICCNRITEERTEEQEEAVKAMHLALYLNLSLCALKEEEWEEAIVHTTQVLDLDKRSAKALFRRAQAHEAREDWDEAIKDLST